MDLYRKKDKLLIYKSIHYTKTFAERVFGLMAKKPYGIILNTRFGVHTFFMIEPIDILILDQFQIVKKIFPAISPFQIVLYSFCCPYVIELPVGHIQHIRVGDMLMWE